MTKIYKIYEDFETNYVLATTDGVINVANNISKNMGIFIKKNLQFLKKQKILLKIKQGLTLSY